jgi:hypothetical protein
VHDIPYRGLKKTPVVSRCHSVPSYILSSGQKEEEEEEEEEANNTTKE